MARMDHVSCFAQHVYSLQPFDLRWIRLQALTFDAADGGSVACLDFVWRRFHVMPRSLAWASAHGGSLDCLRYAHQCGAQILPDTAIVAIRSGSLDCLQYALQHGGLHSSLAAVAAAYGTEDMLQLVAANGARVGADVMGSAARRSASFMQLARDLGAPWHPRTTWLAALAGRADCLRYAAEQGAPWHPRTAAVATVNDAVDCLRIALDYEQATDDLAKTARMNDARRCMALLRVRDAAR